MGSGDHWPQQKLIRQEESSVTTVGQSFWKISCWVCRTLAVSGPCTHGELWGRTLAVFSATSEREQHSGILKIVHTRGQEWPLTYLGSPGIWLPGSWGGKQEPRESQWKPPGLNIASFCLARAVIMLGLPKSVAFPISKDWGWCWSILKQCLSCQIFLVEVSAFWGWLEITRGTIRPNHLLKKSGVCLKC